MNFALNLESFAANTALIDESGRQLSYADLVKQCAQIEQQLGHEKKLILLLCKNQIDCLIGYLACLRAKHAAILIDGASSKDVIADLIERYHPDYLWQEEQGHYQLLPCQHQSSRPILHQELALLLTTSGSTGSPKLVRLSQKNLSANAQAISQYLSLTAQEKAITSLPIHYSYGLSVINSHLHVGACILLTQASLSQQAFWDFFKRYCASSLAGVPYSYDMLLKFRLLQMPLPSLRYLTQAGGRLTNQSRQALAELAEQKKLPLFIMYGQTEATARIAYLAPAMLHKKQGSIGRAIPGGQLQLIDKDGLEITKAHCEGELVYHGPNVMMGYANDATDLALGDLMQERLPTGDLAYVDEEGYYYLSGRLKRMLKLFGHRFNLDELEQQLNEQDFACACCGVDDHLFIATTKTGSKEQLKSYILARYKLHHSSVNVQELTSLPKNSQGKILYKEVLELMRGQDA